MVQYRSALTSCGRLLSKSLYLAWVKIIKLVHPLFVLIRRFEGFTLLTRQPFVMDWASIRSHKNTWRPVNTLLDYKRSLQGSKLAELLIRSLLPSYNGVNECFLKFQSKKVLTRARLIQWERFWGWAEKRHHKGQRNLSLMQQHNGCSVNTAIDCFPALIINCHCTNHLHSLVTRCLISSFVSVSGTTLLLLIWSRAL